MAAFVSHLSSSFIYTLHTGRWQKREWWMEVVVFKCWLNRSVNMAGESRVGLKVRQDV